MKYILHAIALYLIFSISLCAQEYEISGSVVQKGGAEVAFANLMLYQVLDTSFVNGTISDESGFFSLAQTKPGIYLLLASYMGNRSEYVPVQLDSDLDIGPISIEVKVQELDEVVMISKKPTVERKIDRLTFNIEGTALSESNVWEVLKNTPGLFVMNDEITIKGETGIRILINDKKINLPAADILDLLNGTSANSVQAIEVITAPPSKYDAEGGAIINIKMKENPIAGYNGSIYNNYTQGIFAEHNLGTNHYFKIGKLGTSFNYSYGLNKEIIHYTDITHFMENREISESWTSHLEDMEKGKRHNASLFMDYMFDGNNSLSFSTISTFRPRYAGLDASETRIEKVGDPNTGGFFTDNNWEHRSIYTSYYLDYERKLNEEGTYLNLNSHFTYYNYDKEQVLETDFYDRNGMVYDENDFSTSNWQQTRLFSLQADFNTTFGEKLNMETGLKYTLTRSRNHILQEGFDRGQPGIDPTEDGLFLYDENIYAAYVSFDSKWENWTFKSGLRWEHTKTIGDYNQGNGSTEKDYLGLFPTLYLQFDPHDKHHFGINFKRSVIRPDYSDVNPFQVFQSNSSIVEGNVDLRPSYKNSLIFNYTYNKDYTFELFYRYHKDIISLYTFQDNTSKLLRFTTDNSDRELAYGMDFIYNKGVTKFWNTYFLSSYFYRAERFMLRESGGEIRDNGRWTFLMQFNNDISLLRDRSLTANINFTYVSPIAMGNSKQEEYKQWGLSVKKDLWGKKVDISLSVSDIFNQFQLHNARRYDDQYNTSLYDPDSRRLTLGLRYNFGNMGLKSNYKSKGTDEEDRL